MIPRSSASPSRRLLVLIPSLDETGPIRGAIAFCNGAVDRVPVTLVPLKAVKSEAARLTLRPEVRLQSLANLGWPAKAQAVRALADRALGSVVSLSYCLSADAMNWTLRGRIPIASSMRANLRANYRFDMGWKGPLIARAHYRLLTGFDLVFSMSAWMTDELQRFGVRRLASAGNFVDEPYLEGKRRPAGTHGAEPVAVYVGSFSRRKRVDLLLDALAVLRSSGTPIRAVLCGDGPERAALQTQAARLGIADSVQFLGHVSDPLADLQAADVMVLPSESEGQSRAVLEALYYGVPCVLRDVEAAREIITPQRNGNLFGADSDLPGVIRQILAERAAGLYSPARNLLPDRLRQQRNVDAMLDALLGLSQR